MDTKVARAWGLILDYIIWYVLMYLMILFYFFVILKETPFSGNLAGYADIFKDIMFRPSFLIIYMAALIIYEVIIPLFFGGQTISKRIFKIKVEPFSVHQTIFRGIIKLLIINPCGFASFLIGSFMVDNYRSIISDILWIIFAIDAILVATNRLSIQDCIMKTRVEKESK